MAQRGDPVAPAKVSFSLANVKRRPPLPIKSPLSADVVEYVTSVDAESGVVVSNPRAVRGARVVPKQEDSWRPEKRMKNIMQEADATRSTDETFEMETMDAGPKPNVQYGLMVMSRGDGEGEGEGEGAVRARPLSLKELEDQKLKEDLSNLPEEATLEQYEELPVEEFAEALLRGMGWEKGKPIGRNSKVLIAPIEVERRQGTLGLGAVAAPPKVVDKKYIKPGESRTKPPSVKERPSHRDGEQPSHRDHRPSHNDRASDGERSGHRDHQTSHRDRASDGERSRDRASNGERTRDRASNGERTRDRASSGERVRDRARDGERARDRASDGERSRDRASDGERSRNRASDGGHRNHHSSHRERPSHRDRSRH